MSVELMGTFGDDLMVVNAARISYDRWHDEFKHTDRVLIKRLAREGHNSPFYHPVAQMRITAPYYVAAQLKRHHVGLAINEVSRRYTARNITFGNIDHWEFNEEFDKAEMGCAVIKLIDECERMYDALINAGVKIEYARGILPAITNTTWLWTGSLFAWANMCRERLQDNVQLETKQIAESIHEIMANEFPYSWKYLVSDYLKKEG